MKKYVLAGAVSVVASPAWAGGFGLNAQSAETLGYAMAGAQAMRASPGSAYYNPASIVGVDGVEGSLSIFGVFVDSGYETATAMLLGGVPASGTTSGEATIGDGVFPDGTIAAPLGDRFYIGLALNAPFGFSSAYDDTSVLRYHGTSSKVISASLTPILGFAINDDWSIAAGPRIQYMDVSFEGYIDAAGVAAGLMVPGFVPGTDDAFFEVGADNFGFGYVVGLQGALAPNLHVGASYTSKIDHDFDGEASFDIASSVAGQTLAAFGLFQDGGATAPLTAPASVQFGARYDLSPSVSLMASGVWTQWSDFSEVAITFDNPAQPAEIVTQNWRDTWAVSAGLEAQASQSTTVRFGVMVEQTPVVDEFASPRIPDADRVWLAAGLSQDLGDRAELHVGASYVVIDDRPIDQPATRPENLFRGSAQTNVTPDSVVLSIGLDFKF